MALGGMLKNLGGRGASGSRASLRGVEGGPGAVDAAERLAMLDAFEEAEIGWLWATDADGRLTYLSSSAIAKFGDGVEIIGEHLGKLLESVAETGRSALAETGRLLHVVRDEADELGLAPAPGLADVPALVGAMRDQGLDVDAALTLPEHPLSGGVDVSAFRLLQEAHKRYGKLDWKSLLRPAEKRRRHQLDDPHPPHSTLDPEHTVPTSAALTGAAGSRRAQSSHTASSFRASAPQS